MDDNKTIKDSQPYRIGEDSDVIQEAEIIQSDSISESEIGFIAPDEEDQDFNVIEIDDMICVYGPPNDIIDEDIIYEDLFDTDTETIDEVTFVYGPRPEIIHHKHKQLESLLKGTDIFLDYEGLDEGFNAIDCRLLINDELTVGEVKGVSLIMLQLGYEYEHIKR